MIPDLSVFWVIFFVLLLTLLLNQLLFKPIVRVIGAREGAVRDARDAGRLGEPTSGRGAS